MTPQIMIRKLSERDPVDDLVNTFRLFDTDGSGVLTFDKLKKISQGKFRIASYVTHITSTFPPFSRHHFPPHYSLVFFIYQSSASASVTTSCER